MRILIPTYRRIHNQRTWNTLAPALRKYVTFIVRPDEAAEMARLYTPSKVAVLPPNKCTGYIGAMQHLFNLADGDNVIYMDDDITGTRRHLRFFTTLTCEQSRWSSETLVDADAQHALLDALIEQVRKPFVAACSPQPPHVPPMARLIRSDGTRPGQHTVMFVAFNTARIRAAGIEWGKHEGADCPNAVSDALFNLQLMNAGLDCRYDCRYKFEAVPMFGGQGGITADEGVARKQSVLDAHHRLHQLFPEAVKPKKPGTRVPKTGYINIPYIFKRQRFLNNRREELGIVTNECDKRLSDD